MKEVHEIIITELNAIGYELHLEANRVKYKYTLPGDPPPKERVISLLNELQKNRDKVIAYLRNDIRPLWQKSDGSCYWCGSTQSWRSIYKTTCARCHPPACPGDVIEWIN